MKSTRWPLPVLSCALALLLPALGAASPAWVPVSPFGGALSSVARSPSSPRTVYATTPSGEVFRSDDAAATWNRAGSPATGRLADFLVDPDDPLTVFFLTGGGGLFRSRDGGTTWIEIGADVSTFNAIATEAHTPGGLLAAAYFGLYRSTDQGDHWSLVSFPDQRVLAIASDPYEEGNLLAVLGRIELGDAQTTMRSLDHGITWSVVPLVNVSSGVADDQPHFVFDAARPGTVYAFYNRFGEDYPGPVFRSTDGGATWVQPSTTDVRDLVSTADGTLFATTGFGVTRSTDRGETWEAFGPGLFTPRDEIFHLAPSPDHPGTLLAAGTHGLWSSVDAGAHWRGSNRGIPVADAVEVAVAPTGRHDVLAVAGGRVFRSADRGATWRSVHSEFDALEPYALTFDPRPLGGAFGVAFDGQAASLLWSGDRGHTWTARPFPYGCSGSSLCSVEINSFALDRSHPDTLYVGGSYFYHFGGYGPYFIRSRDGGSSWEHLPVLPGLLGVFVDPQRSAVVYGLTAGRLYKSEDAAKTWRIVGRGLPPFTKRTLAIDPQDPQRLYAGTGRGVFTSHDGGLTFLAMNAGIKRQQIGRILIDPTHSNRLYAAGTGGGVFRWNPGESRWTPLNDGLPVSQFYEALALDPREPTTLYAGTIGSGVLRLDLEEFSPEQE
ncbi:MAG: hypothetical protein ABJC13_00210 [Acidobacteriota bacterium]